MAVKLKKLDTYSLSPAETNLMQKRTVEFWDYGRLHSMALFLDFVMESDCLPGWKYIHYNPNNYAFELPLSGELIVTSAERNFRLTCGDVLLLPPGEYNRLETPRGCRKLSFGLLGELLIPTIPVLFGNRTFLSLDASTPRHDGISTVKVDAVFVSRGFKGNLQAWLEKVKSDLVVLDTGISAARRTKFLRECRKSGVRVHDLDAQGALEMPIDRHCAAHDS